MDTYEKKYSEALKDMRTIYPNLKGDAKLAVEHAFPELKESEDERIRKKLYHTVMGTPNDSTWFDGTSKEAMLAYLEKQKDASKAIEAIERIDKYIDEHLANAHDMKDSNPDKKYYRGWDDALGKMSGILQDVYSNEKQKEPRYTKRNALFDKCVENCDPEVMQRVSDEVDEMLQKEQKPTEWKPQPESLEALMYAIEGKWEKIKPTSYLSRRLEDLYDGLVNTYNVNEAFLAELPKTAYTAEDIEELKVLKDKIDASMDEKPVEWSEEDESCLKRAIWYVENPAPLVVKDTKLVLWLKSLPERFNLQPKQEWSEEDIDASVKSYSDSLPMRGEFQLYHDALVHAYRQGIVNALKSLRPVSKESLQSHWKPSEEQN